MPVTDRVCPTHCYEAGPQFVVPPRGMAPGCTTWSGGLDGWRVAVQGLGSVGADGGCCAVGVEGELPAPPVDGDEVVEPAEEGEVGQGVPAAVFAVLDVVDFAAGRGQVAAREPAVPVAFADGAAQVHRNGIDSGGDVQRQTDGGSGDPGGAAAQPGSPAGRSGQQRDGPGEHVPVRCLRRGLQFLTPLGAVGVVVLGEQAVVGHRVVQVLPAVPVVRAGQRPCQLPVDHAGDDGLDDRVAGRAGPGGAAGAAGPAACELVQGDVEFEADGLPGPL